MRIRDVSFFVIVPSIIVWLTYPRTCSLKHTHFPTPPHLRELMRQGCDMNLNFCREPLRRWIAVALPLGHLPLLLLIIFRQDFPTSTQAVLQENECPSGVSHGSDHIPDTDTQDTRRHIPSSPTEFQLVLRTRGTVNTR